MNKKDRDNIPDKDEKIKNNAEEVQDTEGDTAQDDVDEDATSKLTDDTEEEGTTQLDDDTSETDGEWEFEAEAHTLEDTDVKGDVFEIKDRPKKQPKSQAPRMSTSGADTAASSSPSGFGAVKITLFCIILAAVIGVLVFFGIRYYTVPNGHEGDKLNPGGTVMTIDDVDISIGIYNYYYNWIVQHYVSNASQYGIDTTTSYAKQYTTDEDGNKISWAEMFKQQALEQLTDAIVNYNAGVKAGYKMTADNKKEIKENIDSVKQSAEDSAVPVDDYISSTYGKYCTIETLTTMFERAYIADVYYQHAQVNTKVTDSEFKTYFKKNSQKYQSIDYALVEMSYDTSSDAKKAADVKKAKQYAAKFKTVDDMKKAIPEVSSELIKNAVASGYFTKDSEAVDQLEQICEGTMTYQTAKSSLDTKTVTWLFNKDTPMNAVSYYASEDDACIYILMKTSEPTYDKADCYTVRHILITPESDDATSTSTSTEYTKEQWAAAKTKAEKLYNQWKKGDADEFSFATLAEENSADTGSTSAGGSGVFGGLYGGENTTKGKMVAPFENWGFDKSRKYGDTGIVKTDYGYHIMFFVDACPVYEYNCKQDILSDKRQKAADDCKVITHKSVMKKATEATPTPATASSASGTQAVQ